MQTPAPGQRPGMPPAGGPGMPPGGGPAGGPGGAPAPGGMPMQPMVPHQVLAMQPRPYPNAAQMMQPVGLAAVARQNMLAQQAAAQQAAAAPKGKAEKAVPEKKEPPAA